MCYELNSFISFGLIEILIILWWPTLSLILFLPSNLFSLIFIWLHQIFSFLVNICLFHPLNFLCSYNYFLKNFLLYCNIPENSPSYFAKVSMGIYEHHGVILTWYARSHVPSICPDCITNFPQILYFSDLQNQSVYHHL